MSFCPFPVNTKQKLPQTRFFSGFPFVHFYPGYLHIHPPSTTLAAIPHTVAKNAPGSVYRVFFTFTLRKYTLIV